jgi:hypothetical protein
MPVTAPLRVPVELCRENGQRWFRLASGISLAGLRFPRPLPPDLDGPLALRFHLPLGPLGSEDTPRELRLDGRAVLPREADGDGEPRAGEVLFVQPDEETRSRIARYVEERVPPT